jgi:hypothetical protein
MFRSSTKFTYVKAIFIKTTDRRLFLISKPISLGLRLYNWEHDTSTFWEPNSFSTSQETLRVLWNIKVYYSRGAQIRVEYIFRFAPNIFRTITAVFSPLTNKNVCQVICTEQKAKDNSEVQRSLQNSGSSVWNLLHVTLTQPRIWKWLLDFWKIWARLKY